jgi:hypothetical protein
MAEFRHMRASWSSEVPRSATQFVRAAADWVGSMLYLHENPFNFTKCVYAEGSSKDKLPCTRLMYLDKRNLTEEQAANLPEYFRETLWKVDEEAHVLFYGVEGEVLGMRNYFANKEVEPLASDRCRVAITARFDLLRSVPPEPCVEMLQRVYRAVILGIGNKMPKIGS